MKTAFVILLGLCAVATVAVAADAVFASSSSSYAAAPWTGAFSARTQQIHLTITSPGRDENTTPANFAVRPLVPVHVSVVNYTATQHTFTVPGLHVSFLIPRGTAAHPARASFTFIPRIAGVYVWYCAIPCGRFMGGKIYAIEENGQL